MPECEAERRIKQALYELELQWGAGHFDVGKIRGLLTGKPSEQCAHTDAYSGFRPQP